MSQTVVPVTTAAPAAVPAAAIPAGAPVGDAGVAGKHDNASLYVGDLNPEVTEAILYETFKTVGQVASVRVCRHALTRQSLGYAYVNFTNAADAARALQTLNYQIVKGSPIRIMMSCRDPQLRKEHVGNVFIKNLAKSIDERLLRESFEQFGTILSCKIVRDDSGESRGHGFVHFETPEAAEEAIRMTNGVELEGKKVVVCHFQPRRERQEKYTNLYVKNIPKAWSDDELRKFFEPLGEVKSAAVMRDESTGASKGFGFVNFSDPAVAARAADEMANKTPEGADEPLYVSRAMKKSERERVLRQQRTEMSAKFQGVNLYIKNLDEAIDDAKLTDAFKPFGNISSAQVKRNDKGVSKGFGFVCYSAPEEAQRAIVEMNGKMLGTKPIYVALHEPKEIRKAKLEAQHQARQVQRIPHMMGNAHMFPAQPPMYYNQAMAQRQPFMFPQGGMPMPRQGGPRPPFAMAPGAAAGPMPHNAMRRPPTGGRGRGQSGRGGAAGGRGRGYKGGKADDSAQVVNSASLAQMSEDERRVVLGNALFAAVHPKNPANAKKIVGMLLEMDPSEILAVLENEAALDEKIQEAVETLTSADMPEPGHQAH